MSPRNSHLFRVVPYSTLLQVTDLGLSDGTQSTNPILLASSKAGNNPIRVHEIKGNIYWCSGTEMFSLFPRLIWCEDAWFGTGMSPVITRAEPQTTATTLWRVWGWSEYHGEQSKEKEKNWVFVIFLELLDQDSCGLRTTFGFSVTWANYYLLQF